MADTEEKWVPVAVATFATAYEVSSFGRIRSKSRLAGNENFIRRIRGGFMKGRTAKDGHRTVILCFKRQRQKFAIRHLVADAFIPKPEQLSEATHRNGDLSNCRADNLARVNGASSC